MKRNTRGCLIRLVIGVVLVLLLLSTWLMRTQGNTMQLIVTLWNFIATHWVGIAMGLGLIKLAADIIGDVKDPWRQ